MKSHENVLIFTKHPAHTYNPQKTSGHEPIRSSGKSRGLTPLYNSRLIKSQHGETQRYPLSVISCPTDNIKRGSAPGNSNYFHPTQKPVALLEWLIRTYTNVGDTVLDPTAGSGTTAVAALRTGRHSICIEKDAGYYDVMCKRVADERARLETQG